MTWVVTFAILASLIFSFISVVIVAILYVVTLNKIKILNNRIDKLEDSSDCR